MKYTVDQLVAFTFSATIVISTLGLGLVCLWQSRRRTSTGGTAAFSSIVHLGRARHVYILPPAEVFPLSPHEPTQLDYAAQPWVSLEPLLVSEFLAPQPSAPVLAPLAPPLPMGESTAAN
jgi:hypothetical protein